MKNVTTLDHGVQVEPAGLSHAAPRTIEHEGRELDHWNWYVSKEHAAFIAAEQTGDYPAYLVPVHQGRARIGWGVYLDRNPA